MFNLHESMKYKIFTFLLVSSLSINSYTQEFDEAFLKSLPDDIAADLLDRAAGKEELEETQYRRPSTFIKKAEPTSDRFGANIFSMMQTSLMPINEPNFDGDYILDFGDQLELQLIGQKSLIIKLLVQRDGSLSIPDIGKLYLSGLSLSEATELIKKKFSQSFIGVEAFVTLVNVRDIQIIVAGNVYNPGSYTLNGNSNVFHALSVSGGPSAGGSFRSIDLIRGNKKIKNIDLYDTFIYGKSYLNTRLRSGDIVFVNPANSIVKSSGAFKRTGTYELLDDENLSQLLYFSNGLTSFADNSFIRLERLLDGEVKQLPISNLSQFNNIKAEDGDTIFIRTHPFRTIEISGAVHNPGTYLMNEGDSLLQAIEKAGGYTKTAYPYGAVYENIDAYTKNTEALEKLYLDSLDSIQNLVQQTGPDADFTPLIAISERLKEIEPSGRIIIDFNSPTDQFIQSGDTLYIPEKTNQIYLFGALSSSGSAQFIPGKDANYYFNKKGGLSDSADKDKVYVIQPNGETFNIKFNKNIFVTNSEQVEIMPGSIIYVPELIQGSYANRLTAQAYATILGNIGVTLASLSVLKN
jgi:protein involved in polysaccharide export with SLBB domain